MTRFKVGDRVIGCVLRSYPKTPTEKCRHTINLVTGRPEHGAFAHYSIVPEIKAAILPSHITFQDGCVIPFALEAAVCVLSVKEAGFALPEVPIPALGLGYPSSEKNVKELGKTLVIHGGSSSVGSMTTQVARATGINVVSIVGPANMDLAKRSGANIAIDRHTPDLVEKVLAAVHDIGKEFIGIFDAIGDEGTLKIDLEILDHLQGGHLALTHPPPPGLPENVKAGMIFAVNDIATPVWQDFVTPALENGRLQCLPPPLVVGNDLGAIQKTLEMSKAGVSGRKLVVLLD